MNFRVNWDLFQLPPAEEIANEVRSSNYVRLAFTPVVQLILCVSAWGFSIHLYPEVVALIVFHLVYSAGSYLIGKRASDAFVRKMALVVAIGDAAMYTAWLYLIGEAGPALLWMYVTGMFGLGLRTGLMLMHLYQVLALLGFVLVYFTTTYFATHPWEAFSFVSVLVVVPLFTSGIIKRLRAALALAKEQSKAKSQLLAKVSHELRTPLSGIVAAANTIMLRSRDYVFVAERAKTVVSLSLDLMEEINKLLDQAKYSTEGAILEHVDFAIKEVRDIVQASIEDMAKTKKLEFVMDFDARISKVLRGDPHHLSRALINMAGNAVKFTPSGRVTVSAILLEDRAEYEKIRFAVNDTGIGIAKMHHAKIFDAFYQAGDGISRKYGGTGLGMTITREIVETMGGRINLESAPGQGARFWFDLDIRKGGVMSVDGKTAQPVVKGSKILLVDDNDTNLLLIKELLCVDEHDVVTVNDGPKALEALKREQFDIVFLDFNMGEVSGADVLAAYRHDVQYCSPVYFLTADATKGTAAKLRLTGAAGVLNKPVVIDDLRAAIAEAHIASGAQPAAVAHKPTSIIQFMPPELDDVRTYFVQSEVPVIESSKIENIRSMPVRVGFAEAFIGASIADMRQNCSSLCMAIRSNDRTAIGRSAHALKGICASVGAERLRRLADGLCDGRLKDTTSLDETLDVVLREALEESVRGLSTIMAERPAAQRATPT